jgi:hypothetical protein
MASNVTTLSAGFILSGDTVVMPCGAPLVVARAEYIGNGDVALFTASGERFIMPLSREVGIVGDVAHRDR